MQQEREIAALPVVIPYLARLLQPVVAADQQAAILAPERYQEVPAAVAVAAGEDRLRLEPPVTPLPYLHHKGTMAEMDLLAAKIMAVVVAAALERLAQMEPLRQAVTAALVLHRQFLAVL